MKTLDRYVVGTFLWSALLWFLILMSLRVVADLFVNMDEFTEHKISMLDTVVLIFNYYRYQTMLYFMELGGITIAAAAVFSLARMNHTNELTAMLASGVNLRRVVWPIVVCSILLGGLIIADQELLIPRYAEELATRRGKQRDREKFPVMLMPDERRAIWYAHVFDSTQRRMDQPIVLIRDRQYRPAARVYGHSAEEMTLDGQHGWVFEKGDLARITLGGISWPQTPSYEQIWSQMGPAQILTESKRRRQKEGQPVLPDNQVTDIKSPAKVRDALYSMTLRADRLDLDPVKSGVQSRGGRLTNPRFHFTALAVDSQEGDQAEIVELGTFLADSAVWVPPRKLEGGHWKLIGGRYFFPSDLTTEYLVLRQSSRWISYMSTSQLTQLIDAGKVRGDAALMTKHTRFTSPLNNLIMLLLALPFILSREHTIKSSAGRCLLVVGIFYVSIYGCRYIGISPVVASWLPAFIFGPPAFVMLDTVKT
jgi:lipopolysaccharide export LptBFGC system permease protein LptF